MGILTCPLVIPSAKMHVNALAYLPHKLIPTSLFFFPFWAPPDFYFSHIPSIPLPALSGARGYDGSHGGLLSRQPCQRDGGDARTSAHTLRIHALLCRPVRCWVVVSLSIFAAFIPRRFGERVQDVWDVEAPAEVSLYISFVCTDQAVCLLKEHIEQGRRLLQRPGSSCLASCCWKWCPALLQLSFPVTSWGFEKKHWPVSLPGRFLVSPNWSLFFCQLLVTLT